MPPVPEMPIVPFQRWLDRKVQLVGVQEVAATIGVDEARVRRIQRGEYTNNHGELHKMEYLTLRLVDKWVTALGDHYLELYPEMADAA